MIDSKYSFDVLQEIQLGGEQIITSTVVFYRVPNELCYRDDRLLLGEQIAKDILSPLAELEALVRIQDHCLHECLGLLTTRFPNGFDGQAPFRR